MDSRINSILQNVGATLVRSKKHLVWRLPNGKNFVQASTPSDWRAEQNMQRDLRKALEIADERGKEGERREKRAKPGRLGSAWRSKPTINTAIADQLRLTGVRESQLSERIAELERNVSDRDRTIAELRRNWGVRLAEWWIERINITKRRRGNRSE